MKSALFVLGLALCCIVQAEATWKEVTATEEQGPYLGTWVSLGVACDSPDILEQVKGMAAFESRVSIPRADVVSVSSRIHMPDGCKSVTYEFRKGEDGKYYTTPDDTVVIVESVKVMGDYAISTINAGNQFRTTMLHSRSVTQDPDMLQKFKDECKKLGYTEDQIVLLVPTVECKLEE